MKIVYLLAALMLIGIILMSVASYKVFSSMQPQGAGIHRKSAPVSLDPQSGMYVVVSYLGLTLFVVGAIGSIFALFQVMNRRF